MGYAVWTGLGAASSTCRARHHDTHAYPPLGGHSGQDGGSKDTLPERSRTATGAICQVGAEVPTAANVVPEPTWTRMGGRTRCMASEDNVGGLTGSQSLGGGARRGTK